MTPKITTSKASMAIAALVVIGALIVVSAANAAAGGRRSGPFSRTVIASRASAGLFGAAFGRPSALSSSVIFTGVPGAAPTVPVGDDPVGVAVDPSTRTVYVANGGDGTVSVINDASCHAHNLSGCGGAAVATFNADADGLTLSVDRANHTLYVGQSDTVAMINTTTCNASNVAGCNQPFASAPAGNFPGFAAIDQARTRSMCRTSTTARSR